MIFRKLVIESAGEEVECGRNEDVETDVWCYKDGHNRE